MKVLFVLNAFGPVSGAENVLLDFLKKTPEIEPFFLHIGPVKPNIKEFLKITSIERCYYVKIDSFIMSPLSRQWFMKIFRAYLYKQIKKSIVFKEISKKSFDLVYFNNSFEAGAFYPLFENKKTIVHIHDMVDMFRPAHKKCVLESCTESGFVLTASEACRNMLIKNGIDPSRVATVYNSIDINKENYIEHYSDKITIGFVGSAIKRKGFDTYIKILNELNRQDIFNGRKIKAIIITNSKQEEPFFENSLSKLDIDIECNVNYGIPREMVFDQYKNMDLLLVPSRFDPLPTVILEASLKGVPVVGSNKDGIPEMQIDANMLFNVDDVKDAVCKVRNWIELPFDEKKIKMNNLQTYILNNFTAIKKRKIVLDVMNKILAN